MSCVSQHGDKVIECQLFKKKAALNQGVCAEEYLGFTEMSETFSNTFAFEDSKDLKLVYRIWPGT